MIAATTMLAAGSVPRSAVSDWSILMMSTGSRWR